MAKVFYLVVLFLSSLNLLSADFKLGVIDEQMVIDKSKKGEYLMSKLTAQVEEKQAFLDGIKESLRNMEREIALVGDAKKQEILLKMNRSKVELEVEGKIFSDFLAKQQVFYTKQLVKEINETIEIIGNQEGYDLIIRKKIPVPSRNREAEMLPLVYFAKEGVDITQSVLNYMDVKFRQESQSKLEK